nr:MT-A70 family methyltransferase [Filomicrobium insigne]
MSASGSSFISPDLFEGGPTSWPFGDLVPQAYDLVMIDVAWRFKNYSQLGESKGPEPHYRTMSDAEILALPVADLARENCALWMWATSPRLDFAIRVLDVWGFEFVTAGAWNKRRWGTGYVLRSVCEPFLIAKRGNPKIDGRSVPNLIEESRREHSRKPERAYELAEKMMPTARRADVYSRTDRPGWEAFGDEAGKFNEGDDGL